MLRSYATSTTTTSTNNTTRCTVSSGLELGADLPSKTGLVPQPLAKQKLAMWPRQTFFFWFAFLADEQIKVNSGVRKELCRCLSSTWPMRLAFAFASASGTACEVHQYKFF